MMKTLSQKLAIAGVAAALICTAGLVNAQDAQPRQGRQGWGDPEQMRQRMNERIREMMDVKDDAEWKIIEERIQKVQEARREVGFGGAGMRAMFRRPGADTQGDQSNRRRFGPEPSAEELALQKAIESKASKEELKAAMAKYREARKEKEAKLKQAQDDLKKVLTIQQEAVALSLGLVD